MKEVRINESWKKVLKSEFKKSYWEKLTMFVRSQYFSDKVYPPPKNIFHAFDLCPFDKVKVVIVGQDPYHGKGQANGLSFAVEKGVSLPPSLQNIYKEIKNDLGIIPYQNGDLSRWAKQGVLMLNSVLTVAANQPGSHKNQGWEEFTDEAIGKLSKNRKHIVYMLWGNYAKNKGEVVDKKNNLVLTSAHPSPYSAQLFFGNKHFSSCNTYLVSHGMSPIDWR